MCPISREKEKLLVRSINFTYTSLQWAKSVLIMLLGCENTNGLSLIYAAAIFAMPSIGQNINISSKVG